MNGIICLLEWWSWKNTSHTIMPFALKFETFLMITQSTLMNMNYFTMLLSFFMLLQNSSKIVFNNTCVYIYFLLSCHCMIAQFCSQNERCVCYVVKKALFKFLSVFSCDPKSLPLPLYSFWIWYCTCRSSFLYFYVYLDLDLCAR